MTGNPEGRPGIWLIEPATAVSLIDAVPGKEVHNFIGGWDGPFIGADWRKSDAKDLILHTDGLRIALVFPPNNSMKHQLVALRGTQRWMFDVGEIDELVMQEVDAGR